MLVFAFSRLPEKNLKHYQQEAISILQEEMHAVYAVTNASIHKYSNQRLLTNSFFFALEFLCHLAQKWVLCHYCVCSVGSRPIHLSVSYFLILSLITGLQKAPKMKDWYSIWSNFLYYFTLGAHSPVTTLSECLFKGPPTSCHCGDQDRQPSCRMQNDYHAWACAQLVGFSLLQRLSESFWKVTLQ